MALLLSSLDFHSSTIQGNDLRRSEVWLALLSLSTCGGNLSVNRNFLCGLELREMPYFEGFASVSILKAKKSFNHGKIFIGNLFIRCECLSVASRNANNNQRYKSC